MKRFPARAMVIAGLATLATAGAPCSAAESQADRDELKKSLSEAQARLDKAASEVAELSRQLYGGPEGGVMGYVGASRLAGRRGAMLGVNIGTEKPRESGVENMLHTRLAPLQALLQWSLGVVKAVGR